MKTDKPFTGFNHGTDQITLELSREQAVLQMKPTQIHLKEDGILKDKLSLVIVMTRPMCAAAFGEISLEMFNQGLADIGYEIVKKDV